MTKTHNHIGEAHTFVLVFEHGAAAAMKLTIPEVGGTTNYRVEFWGSAGRSGLQTYEAWQRDAAQMLSDLTGQPLSVADDD
jgi:hypothetical protein